MSRPGKRFNLKSKKRENNPIPNSKHKSVETTLRKPFEDRGNLLNKSYTRRENAQHIVGISSTKNDSFQKKSNSSIVYIEHLSAEELQKHFKECSVILPNLSMNSLDESKYVNLKRSNLVDSKCVGKEDSKKKNTYVEIKGHLLRKQKRIDYAEYIQNSTIKNIKSVEHIPVYQQQIHENKKVPKDIYEFVSDSEKKSKKQRTLDRSIPFEKSMKLIMYKLEAKLKKQSLKNKQIFHTANIKGKKAAAFKKIGCKETESNKIKINKKNLNTNLSIHIKKSPKKNCDSHVILVRDNIEELELHGNGSILVAADSKCMKLNSMHSVSEPKTNILSSTITNIKSQTTKKQINIIQNIQLNAVTSEVLLNTEKEMLNVQNTEPGSLFQRDDVQSDEDIFETADYEYFDDFDHIKSPNANSTMVNIKKHRENSIPWRADLQYKRNPHYLQYKDTFLPSYNQDMVIDNSITEKICSGNKTPNNINHSRKTRQSTLKSYINGKDLCDSSDIVESSLFDIHELSPIKLCTEKASKSSANKENNVKQNLPVKRQVDQVKRRILGEKMDNSQNILNTMESPSGNNESAKENISYFGFEDISDHDENTHESHKVRRKEKMNIHLAEKPTRFDDYLIFNRKRKLDNKIQTTVEQHVEESVPNISMANNELNGNIALFEDLEPINKHSISRRYDRVNKFRRRRMSIDRDGDNENLHTRKKKKDMRTKEEEEDAENWATAFNAMCKEVEQFPLELE